MINQCDLNFDEKYRPKTIKEIVGQPHLQMQLENMVQIGKIPHLLFHGQPGVGKTSTAVALANDLFGKLWQYNLLPPRGETQGEHMVVSFRRHAEQDWVRLGKSAPESDHSPIQLTWAR